MTPIEGRLLRLAVLLPPCLVVGGRSAFAGDVLDWATSLMNGCWSCDAVGTIVQIGLGFAEQSFTAIAGQTANLLGLLMAIWILFFAASLFLPFGPEGAVGGLWNKGAKKLFQFAVVLAFLQGSQAIWGYIFIPVMSSGMGFSKAIVSLTDPYEVTNGTSETGPSSTDGTATYCAEQSGGAVDGVDGAIAVMNQMKCPLATIQSQFGKGMLIGVAQTIGAVNHGDIAGIVCAIVGGLVLIGVYFFGLVMFPIFLIDVLMRVTIVTAISPIALAAWLFEPTRRIAEKALWQIVHAALTLVFVSIVGGIGKATLSYVFSHLSLNGVAAGARDWKSLIQMLEDQSNGNGQSFYIDLTTMAFYQLLGVGVILIFMLRQAGKMAAEFSGAGGGDFSGAMAGVAATAGGAVAAGGGALHRLTSSGGGKRQNAAQDRAAKVTGTGESSATGG
ncbi:type IV secretion system protein [Telmatospirillum sp.]|uniref:type IV secretion system protein n=1 Tax=Telmatospirillum sp. TaxID=2079197 RepID=UPI00285099FC|nr:type IV secretion system protein [Telmatospirillum sp.]MDR3439226.1 type IV secretion system protein [Telmatospirillum sp.]